MIEIRRSAINLSKVDIDVEYINSILSRVGADNVDLDNYGENGQLMVTRGVGWHKDPSFGPLTAFVVVGCYEMEVSSWGCGTVWPDRGDVVLLDVRKNHRAKPTGIGAFLVAIAVDLPLGTSMDEAIQRLKKEISGE